MDPISSALVSAATAAGSDGAKTANGLLTRALGPTADAIGQDLAARYSEYRQRNTGRIIGRAEKKARESGRSGSVHPRVAHRVIEEGSFCDDAVMADYLGGLLAGGRTPNGRDDRAVVWSNLVTALSAAQIRLHYLLYREWAIRLHGRIDVNLGVATGRKQALMYTDLTEVVMAFPVEDEDRGTLYDLFIHALIGLVRQGLLEPIFSYGPRGPDNSPDAPYPNVLSVQPSVAAMELYGWAQGLPGLIPTAFVLEALPFDVDPPLPLLQTALLLGLPERNSTELPAS